MTQPTTYAKVESALFTLATHRADDRAEWIRIGQAIHEWNDDQDTFDLWMRWSQTSAKCKPNELARIWPGFQPGKGITVATLFGAAHEDGWMWTEGNGGDREKRDSSPATPPPRAGAAYRSPWSSPRPGAGHEKSPGQFVQTGGRENVSGMFPGTRPESG